MLRIQFTYDFNFQIALQNLSSLKLPLSFSQESEGGRGREGYLMSCQLLRQMESSFCLYYQMDSFQMLLALLWLTGDEFISLRMPIVSAIWVHLSKGELRFSGIFEIYYSFAMGVRACLSFWSPLMLMGVSIYCCQKGTISTCGKCYPDATCTSSVCQYLPMLLVNALICWLIDSNLGDRSTLLTQSKTDSSTLLSSQFLITSSCLPNSDAIFVIISLCSISSVQICALKLQNSFFILLIAYRLMSFADFSNSAFTLLAFAALCGLQLYRFLRISDSLEDSSGWLSIGFLGLSCKCTDSLRQRWLEEKSAVLSRLRGVSACDCELLFLSRLSLSLEVLKTRDSLE